MNPPFVRSPYNYDVTEASDASAYIETMPSLTVQSMSEDADLNILMQRFGVTGKFPEDVRLPQYGDYTDVGDFHSALSAIRDANDNFMRFPAHVRAQFENNPQLFLDFVENPANIEQTKKWFPKENFDGRQSLSPVSPGSSGSQVPGVAAAGEGPRAAGGQRPDQPGGQS